eukprot:2990016-Rhodomonas_salina.1
MLRDFAGVGALEAAPFCAAASAADVDRADWTGGKFALAVSSSTAKSHFALIARNEWTPPNLISPK